MSIESSAPIAPLEIRPDPPIRWSMRDCWIGLGLLVLLLIGAVAAIAIIRASGWMAPLWKRSSAALQFASPVALELVYVLPVPIILAWRRADWLSLGFRKFRGSAFGLGCALTIFVYVAMMVSGYLLSVLKIETQAEALLGIMRGMSSPAGFVIAGVVAAPFVEEIFFRGFLFQGLRQSLGWKKAALISSAIFAAMHLELVAFLPTFLLGYVFAFVYNRSNSIWPGVILHCLVNSFAMCLLVAVLQLPPAQ